MKDYLSHALDLIARGYPVPTSDPDLLAKMLEDKDRNVINKQNISENSNDEKGSERTGSKTLSR
jgi:hypothetical protein